MPWGFAIGAVATVAAGSMAADAQGDAADKAAASADGSTQLGYAQLDFTKKQYDDAKPYRDKAADLSNQVAEAQLASQTQQNAIAADYNDYNKTTYRPLEQGIVSTAENYDTPEKRKAAADAAMADVNSGFAGVNAATARSLAANGINPGSARAMSVQAGQGVEQAKANAGAAYKARQGVESVGTAMKMDAASLGRNLPSNQTATANSAIQAGNSAVNSTTAALNATNSGVSTVQNGYQGAQSALQGASGTYANLAANGGQAWSSLGSTIGRGVASYNNQPANSPTISSYFTPDASSYDAVNGSDAGFYISDETVKKDVQPVDDDEALEAVNATPVKKWRYDPAKMAARGLPMDDGAEHVGPMAADVQESMGDDVAPGGKKIDPISLGGVNMKAVQAVDKKVVQLTKKVNSLAHLIRAGHMEARAA